ncbi:hypothetical protein WA026_000248 [Henosepilachna vigintioctopunctata]|uniref:Putative inorganic phosphate cotransporter n=1 Tax=Henosepilachna vigintioctopunctata TaxID=420089 RepID=A0AAW1UZU2_9CUCU
MYNSPLGKRHIQYILLFLGGATAFFIRASLSVAIVAMIEKNPPHPGITTYPEWQNKDVILSSFYWGYLLLQIPAGLIGYKYGPKYFIATAFTIGSMFSILAPFLARTFGSTGIIMSRAVQGFSQGFLFPSTHNILSKWTPLPERSRTFAFVYSSTIVGSTLGLPVTGYICSTPLGWPGVFYFSGTAGLLWSLLMFRYCHNNPQEHPSISSTEKQYIEENVQVNQSNSKLDIPWKSIFTSVPFWAILICNMGNNYGFMTMLAEIPSYMQSVLKFDIKENSLLSALPFLTSFIVALFVSPLSDFSIKNKIMSITAARKFFNTFGAYGAATAVICLAFVPPEMKILAVFLLVLAVGTNATTLVGYNVNHVDITPNFAGITMGFVNFSAQVSAIVAPLMVQILVTDQSDVKQWRVVFIIAGVVYFITSTFFLIFASGEVQKWNDGKPKEKKIKTLKEYQYTAIKESMKQDVSLNISDK